jgi:translation initiation factor IF-2
VAKIRAYKLAEELGIDRVEFVERAGEVGVELKTAMVTLDEAQVAELREKLGAPKPERKLVSEKRVGGAVIRRRRKAEPPPPPPVAVDAVTESIAAEPAVVAAELEVAEPSPVAEPEPAPEPVAPAAPQRVAASAQPDSAREARTQPGADRPGRGARKLVREVVNLREQDRLARQATGRMMSRRQVTLDPRTMQSPRRKRRDAAPVRPAAAVPGESRRILRIEGSVSVGEFARLLGAKAPEIQKKLMALGTMVAINQTIDVETARKVATELGFEVQDVGFREEKFLEPSEGASATGKREPRPPVITVMGHVDHGKTSLLDAIRRTNVVAGEAGGITQHIGAYQVEIDSRKLSFIDTPGHAAFTEMRARGAQVTDIVVLVIAASDGIMPQTVEAIDHAKAAGVPIVVAVNKIDLPGANSQQTRQRLMEHDLVPEEFGGDTICIDVSAKQGTGLDKLLEMISLQAEVLELKSDRSRRATGVVLEAQLDKGRGPVATILVQDGTLRTGDVLVVGTAWGRVRAMENDLGQRVKEAGPSVPVRVIGLAEVPEAGQAAHVVENERVGKDIVEHRLAERRAPEPDERPRVSLDQLFAQAEGGVKELPLVIKGDVHGSVEALRDALLKLSTDDVKVNVIHSGVGAVTESDVMLARASGAIVIAFHVRPEPAARREADSQGVDVRTYRVIYDVLDEVRQALAGLLPPTISENQLGRAEVRQTFTVPKIGTIAGCFVADGLIRRGAKCRLVRDGVQIYDGRIGSLKRFKDDAREVLTGFECGIGIEGYNDVKIGDVIEAYVIEEKRPTLE